MTGLDVLARVRADYEGIQIVLLTGIRSEAALADYVQMDVDAIVLKDDPPDRLLAAMSHLKRGKRYFSETAEVLVSRMEVADKLTSRERQVMRHISAGLSNKEISKVMGIAPKTVNAHRTNLMQKLDLHNIAEVVAFALALQRD